MPFSIRELINDRRLAVLAEAIIWGNAYFNPKTGLAVASNGKAYTVSNLHYAASLLEAVSEGRDIELDKEDARTRATAILSKILEPIKLQRNIKRILVRSGEYSCRAFLARGRFNCQNSASRLTLRVFWYS
jgi:hypothetical protein